MIKKGNEILKKLLYQDIIIISDYEIRRYASALTDFFLWMKGVLIDN